MTDAAVCRYCLEAEGLICGQVGVAPKLFSPGLMLVDPLGRPFMNGYKTSKHGCFICFFFTNSASNVGMNKTPAPGLCLSWFLWSPQQLPGDLGRQPMAQIGSLAELRDLWPSLCWSCPPFSGPGPLCQGPLENWQSERVASMGGAEPDLCLV